MARSFRKKRSFSRKRRPFRKSKFKKSVKKFKKKLTKKIFKRKVVKVINTLAESKQRTTFAVDDLILWRVDADGN